jgi:2-C-methyl-D-erythritol 4-phosphate cytidylyltransferase
MATGRDARISTEIETPFLYLDDRPVLAYSLAAFNLCADIDGIVVVIPRERAESVLALVQMLGLAKIRKIVVSGTRRPKAMADGLEHIPGDVEWVCVHDASRPLVTPEQISETAKCAWRNGSGLLAAHVDGPMVTSHRNKVETRMAEGGKEVLSPQTYSRADLLKAYPASAKDRKNFADDVEAMMALGVELRLVPTTTPSLRIQSAEDLAPVLALMK